MDLDFLTSHVFWTWVFFVVEWIIRLVCVIAIPYRRAPSTAKAWLLLIFFEPLLGLLLFAFFGRAKLPKQRQAVVDRLHEVFADLYERMGRQPNIQHPQLDRGLDQAVVLAENLGHLPILGGNQAELLPAYDDMNTRLVADIDAAKHHVHLLFYIFADDAATAPVLAALGRAVARGVVCRVLFDYVGSGKLRKAIVPRLEGMGVQVHAMLPASLLRFRRGRYDLRNHRKIAVIDGRIGYTGSQNMIRADFKPGLTFQELMVRVTGPIVLELQYVFVTDWYQETLEVLDDGLLFPQPEATGRIAAQTLPSGPAFITENNQRVIVALIHGARKRVVMTTPYFIPDEPLLQAMQTAVLRGVEVHLVVSQAADQLLVSLAQRSYYGQLLDAGVKIHLYRAAFLHAKHLSIDDDVALIGSSNLDIRSFALNAEIVLIFYDAGIAAQLHEVERHYFAQSDLVREDEWPQRSAASKIVQNLARMMSPLL